MVCYVTCCVKKKNYFSEGFDQAGNNNVNKM